MIKQAPLSFAVIFVITSLLMFVLVNWVFRNRLEAANELLGYYRERLGLQPADKTRYAAMRNSQLATETLRTANKLRDTAFAHEEVDSRASLAMHEALCKAATQEEREQLVSQQTANLGRRVGQFPAVYEQEFRVDVGLLRDEILSRLPAEEAQGYDTRIDKYVVNTLSARGVAERLERLAKLLPKG